MRPIFDEPQDSTAPHRSRALRPSRLSSRQRIAQAQLRSPWDGLSIAATDAPYNCPEPPPFAKTLNVEGYYTDAHHSIIDEKKREAEEKATEAPTHLGQWSGEAADT